MSSEGPQVSIVLPVYNGSRYVAEAIQSCIDQTFTAWELIIVDDASTDDTPQIIAHYAACDDRIRCIRHEVNRKLPGALNTGFAVARGQYLTWTSDDNRYRPHALADMVAFLETTPDVGLVYADYTTIDETGAVRAYGKVADPHRLTHKACVGGCFLYRRALHEAVGDYDETLFLVEDYEYWLRASLQFRFAPLHHDLYLYRHHEASLTGTRRQEVMIAREQLLVRYLPQLGWAAPHDLAEGYLHLYTLARDRCARWQALRYWLRAARYAPFLAVRRIGSGLVRALFNDTWTHRLTGAYQSVKKVFR